jgi:hypothetical protein
MEDMKKDGIVFSCLSGHRQRFEYFGFYPAGSLYIFIFDEANISHIIGREWKTGLTLKIVKAGDTSIIDQIYAIHEAKRARLHRSRGKFFEILSSWNAKVYSVIEDGRFVGYFISRDNNITEINLLDYNKMAEVIGLYLRIKKEAGHGGELGVACGPHETEKMALLSGIARWYTQSASYQFAVLDFIRFADALIKLKAGYVKIREGSFVLHIEDKARGCDTRLRLFAGSNGAGEEATYMEASHTVNIAEAHAFLLSVLEAKLNPVILENDFLLSLLPLPLYVENPDRI